MNRDAAYWESQYNNRAAVPDHPQYFARWGEESERVRRSVRCYLDVPFGTHAMEKLDLFQPHDFRCTDLMDTNRLDHRAPSSLYHRRPAAAAGRRIAMARIKR